MRLQHLGLVLRVIPNARQCLVDIATSLARKESRTPAEMECETRKSLEGDKLRRETGFVSDMYKHSLEMQK